MRSKNLMRKELIVLLFFLLLSSCSAVNSVHVFDEGQAQQLALSMMSKRASQMLQINLPHDFKRIEIGNNQAGIVSMLIPTNQGVNHWQESFQTSFIPFTLQPKLTPWGYFYQQTSKIEKMCRQFQYQVLARSSKEIFYEFNMAKCKALPDAMLIGKIFAGTEGIYVIHYTALSGEVRPLRTKQGLAAIASTRLVKHIF